MEQIEDENGNLIILERSPINIEHLNVQKDLKTMDISKEISLLKTWAKEKERG